MPLSIPDEKSEFLRFQLAIGSHNGIPVKAQRTRQLTAGLDLYTRAQHAVPYQRTDLFYDLNVYRQIPRPAKLDQATELNHF